ncbi:ABC transporter permease [Enterococcus sp. LJL99]
MIHLSIGIDTEILATVGLFIRLVFTIFVGVMLANIVVKVYETGTIRNLFLYPISKKKVLISKLLLITVVSFLLMFISQVLISGFVSYFNNANQLVEGIIDSNTFIHYMISSVFLMFATISMSMIALFVGLRKKSSVATIITAVIVGILVNGQLGSNTTARISANLAMMVTLAIVGCIIVFLSIKNVNREDL